MASSTHVCAVVSGKGGVGKTMSTYFLADILAGGQNRSIILDFNLGIRGMDMLFKSEEDIVFDLSDILDGKCRGYQAGMFQSQNNPNLKAIAAPSNPFYHFTFDPLYKLIMELREDFNYIFLDAPASICTGFVSAVALCDRAIIVTTPDPMSVTAANKVGHYITNSDTQIGHVLINGVNFQSRRPPIMSNFDGIIDSIGYPLIGVVPFEERLYDTVLKGETLKARAPYSKAMLNIAKRYNNEDVPLIYG